MAATPPTTPAAPSDVIAGRPLSTVELLAAENEDDEEGEEKKTPENISPENQGGFAHEGFANGGFELGSPLTPVQDALDNPFPTVVYNTDVVEGISTTNNQYTHMSRDLRHSTPENNAEIPRSNSLGTERLPSNNGIQFAQRNQPNPNSSLDRNRLRSRIQNDTCSIQIYQEHANGATMIGDERGYVPTNRQQPRYYGAARNSGNFDLITEEHSSLDNYDKVSGSSMAHGCQVGCQFNGNSSPEESSTNSSNDNATIAITTAIVHENRDADTRTRNNAAHVREGTRSVRRFDRPSWLLDGNSRTQEDENLWRRRRKTDPEGNYSYHRDYQEALSSLLWEPYDCRQPTPSTSGNLDDADVSLWLYPPGRNQNLSFPYGRDCPSSSTSTSSMSSSSSTAAVVEDPQWRMRKDISSSSLQPLVMSQSSDSTFLDNRSSRTRSVHVGNTDDPNDGEEFADLDGRRFGTAPVGALVNRCSGYQSRQLFCYEQFECGGRVGSSSGNMLVNVETIPSDTGGNGNPHSSLVSTSHHLDRSNLNSVSVVNCYRAVPVVVSAVPTISCLNNAEQQSNISNVHIVQTSAPAALNTLSEGPQGRVLSSDGSRGVGLVSGRTFTSTEAQTDEISATEVPPNNGVSANNVNNVNNREQRRRERRERRHQRRVNTTHHNNINHEQMWTTQVGDIVPGVPVGVGERLPDILNSHLPPPYSTLPLGLPPGHMPIGPPGVPVPNVCPVPLPVPVQTTVPVPGSPPPQPGIRFPFQIAPTGRRRSRRTPRGQHYTPEEEPKSCCGVIVTQTVSIRWFIVMIAFVGICCAVVGTVLGAMKASGREHLTVSLLMIGVGIVLITVSGVAWRLTAHDAPSCRVMLGLSRGEEGAAEPNRRFVPRLPPSYGRPHHPYAAMMYPEFQYRPPPPSYQASMQEYRLRLLLLDRHSVPGQTGQTTAISPPPTYRSHSGTLRTPLGIRADPTQDFSRPPSYRSRTSSTRPTLDPNGNSATSPVHSRDPSMTESCNGSAVNVISVLGSGVNEPESLDSIKMSPDQDLPLRMMLEKGSHSGSTVDVGKDSNLVTIVSTGNDSSPVIVTVSGSTMATTTMCGSTSQQCVDTEMEILAHL